MELFIAVENEDVPSINEIVKRIDINTIRDDDTDSAIHCQSGSPDNIYKISRSFRL